MGSDPPQGNTRRIRRMGSSARQSDRVKDRDQTVQYSTRGSISAVDKAEVKAGRDLVEHVGCCTAVKAAEVALIKPVRNR